MKKKVEFIFCVGLQSSASTWLYNIIVEMQKHAGKITSSFYSEDLLDIFNLMSDDCQVCVIKSHAVDEIMAKFIKSCDAKVIISTRDVKDIVVSLMDRFGSTFRDAPRDLTKALSSISQIYDSEVLSFRYEDGFCNNKSTLEDISKFLSLEIDVDAFIRSIEFFSFENIKKITDGEVYDGHGQLYERYLFHRNHVSDGEVGKWKFRLSDQQSIAIDKALRNVDEIYCSQWPSGDIFFDRSFFHWHDGSDDPRDGSFVSPGYDLCILWGPYFHLPKGRWRATYVVSIVGGAAPARMKLDVLSGDNLVSLKEVVIGNEGSDDLSIEFYNDYVRRPIEFRIQSVNDGKLFRFEFMGVNITRL